MTHLPPQGRTEARAEPSAASIRDCASAPSDDGEHLRCLCGSLLARYVPGGIELKCRRCKRTVTVPLEQLVQTPDGT